MTAGVLEGLRPGAEVDGFVIGERIHSGAMGNIFEVTKRGVSAPIVMKVPRVGRNEPPEGIISFETEATVLPALQGPYVPRVVAVGDLARTPYLVTEWVAGQALSEILRATVAVDRARARRPVDTGGTPVPLLPVADVASIGASIADALHSMHQQEAIHLDLKPANVIVKPEGGVVLVDFGFAHHARYPDLLAEETRFGAGSAPYISPEQILGTREDSRSDLFALGVVLYEMLTGHLPFGEPDTDVRNRLWLDPVAPRAHRADVPPWMQEIVLRCIEPRAERRYQSAAHVAFDLRNPDQVVLTARAHKLGRAGLLGQLGRFWKARGEHGPRLRAPVVNVSRFPIVMVAVDTAHPDDERQPALKQVTSQILSLSTEFRLVCVTVVASPRIMDGAGPGQSASGVHLEHLVRLRHWVEPLQVPAQRLSLHAIESSKPAEALVEFARANNVDLIVLGAPGPAQPGRTWWHSVASTVTANAHCSVHVVRVAERRVTSR